MRASALRPSVFLSSLIPIADLLLPYHSCKKINYNFISGIRNWAARVMGSQENLLYSPPPASSLGYLPLGRASYHLTTEAYKLSTKQLDGENRNFVSKAAAPLFITLSVYYKET
jgi:hypothetical protein